MEKNGVGLKGRGRKPPSGKVPRNIFKIVVDSFNSELY
jgi:hypothetical protein